MLTHWQIAAKLASLSILGFELCMFIVRSCLILVAVFVTQFLSCGSVNKQLPAELQQSSIPVAVVVENEIIGDVLGARLSQPFGLAVDTRGSLYCVDAGNNRVIQFNADLTPIREIGGYGTTQGLLNSPSFAVVDNGLNLLVTDEDNRRLARYDSHLTFAGNVEFYDSDDPLKFGFPSGVAVTEFGEIWIADQEQNRIAVFNHLGMFDRFVGDFGYSGGQLNSPEKITVSPQGRFLVCDAGNSRIVIYDEYGNHERNVSYDKFDYPIALTITKKGICVLDGSTGRLFFFTHRWQCMFVIGPQLPGAGSSLRKPSDIAALPDGRLVISDTGGDRLLVCRIVNSEQ